MIKPEVLRREYRRATRQLKLCMGGFGGFPTHRGQPVTALTFILAKSRYERMDGGNDTAGGPSRLGQAWPYCDPAGTGQKEKPQRSVSDDGLQRKRRISLRIPCHVGDSEFVLGVHLTAPQQFVTWKCVTGRTTIEGLPFISAICFPRRRIWWRGRRRRCSAWRNSGKTLLCRRPPPYSLHGAKSECETLCPGVYSVSTPGMAALWCAGELAEKVFRKEAMGSWFYSERLSLLLRKIMTRRWLSGS